MKISSIFIVFVLLLFGLSAAKLCADFRDDFNQGVSLYNSGSYEKALASFKGIETLGYSNPELYFNIGNCYFKTNQRGMAVAYYLKAIKLDPRNDDLKANLLFVRSTLRDKYGDSLENPIWGFIKKSSLHFKANELTWFAFILYLALIGVLMHLVLRREKNAVGVAIIFSLIFFIACSGAMLAINVRLNYFNPQGVITDPEVEVLAGPGSASDVRFTVHEGLTFSILRQESGYYEAIFANRLKGWVSIPKAYQF